MASKEQKKLKKKKAREKQAHARVLARRATLRAEAKEKREEEKLDRRIKKLKNKMDEFDFHHEEEYKGLTSKTLGQLEENVKILQTLESEWQEQDDARRNLAEQMDAEGNLTLEDKLRALHDLSIANSEAITDDVVEQTPSVEKLPTEVSDVEVIKADQSTENSTEG